MLLMSIFLFLHVIKKTIPNAREDIFSITGRGTVATGRIETGVVNTGDELAIIGLGAEGRKTVCTGD